MEEYNKHLSEQRKRELYDMTDAVFDKMVFKDASPSEFRSPLDVFTKPELNFILDYSESLGTSNRDWVTNCILDDYSDA